jgi:hypothetical protein
MWNMLYNLQQSACVLFASLVKSRLRRPAHLICPMDSSVKMPIDLVQLPPFRQLRELLGGPERALFVWFILWQELGYRMQEGVSPGRLPGADLPLFLDALTPGGPAPGMEPKAIFQHLLTVRLLRQDGEDYVCPRFALLHGDAGQNRTLAQRGGDMRAFQQRMKKAQGAAFQQSLLIHESKLVDGEGQPLPAEEVKRVMRLIVACDNALFREARPPFGFTEGLIQSALAILQRFTDEEIDCVCRTVALHRHHPALSGLNTEKLLPMFSGIVAKLEGA